MEFACYSKTKYKWFADIMFNACDFDFPDCECECLICVEGSGLDSNEDWSEGSNEESDDSWKKECIERSEIPCKCINSFIC